MVCLPGWINFREYLDRYIVVIGKIGYQSVCMLIQHILSGSCVPHECRVAIVNNSNCIVKISTRCDVVYR